MGKKIPMWQCLIVILAMIGLLGMVYHKRHRRRTSYRPVISCGCRFCSGIRKRLEVGIP